MSGCHPKLRELVTERIKMQRVGQSWAVQRTFVYGMRDSDRKLEHTPAGAGVKLDRQGKGPWLGDQDGEFLGRPASSSASWRDIKALHPQTKSPTNRPPADGLAQQDRGWIGDLWVHQPSPPSSTWPALVKGSNSSEALKSLPMRDNWIVWLF